MYLVYDSKLHYLSVFMQREKVKKQSDRMRSHSQKEIRRELQSISKAIHIPSVQGPSGQPSIMVVGGAMSSTTLLKRTIIHGGLGALAAILTRQGHAKKSTACSWTSRPLECQG